MKASQGFFIVICLVANHGDNTLQWTTCPVKAFQWTTYPHKLHRRLPELLEIEPPSRHSSFLPPQPGISNTQNSRVVLRESNSEEEVSVEKPTTESVSPPPLDVEALVKYILAILVQMSLITMIFKGVDSVLVRFFGGNVKIPFAINCVIFWQMALKSRALNPMNNARPKRDNLETNEIKRKMPSWTPPGILFPIMWILIIAPLRAVATAVVYQTTGTYANVAILSLMLHLSIGDVWNSINNTERRYGASVVGVILVWLSKAHAAYRYHQVLPRAGKLLALPLVWLTIASALIFRTWQLNPDPISGKRYPLYPAKGQGETQFAWFQ